MTKLLSWSSKVVCKFLGAWDTFFLKGEWTISRCGGGQCLQAQRLFRTRTVENKSPCVWNMGAFGKRRAGGGGAEPEKEAGGRRPRLFGALLVLLCPEQEGI